MTRLALSDETEILNRLSYMDDNLYRGKVVKSDVEYSVKTIRNLLLELYLTRSYLDEEENDELNDRIVNAHKKSEAMRMFESNKPI